MINFFSQQGLQKIKSLKFIILLILLLGIQQVSWGQAKILTGTCISTVADPNTCLCGETVCGPLVGLVTAPSFYANAGSTYTIQYRYVVGSTTVYSPLIPVPVVSGMLVTPSWNVTLTTGSYCFGWEIIQDGISFPPFEENTGNCCVKVKDCPSCKPRVFTYAADLCLGSSRTFDLGINGCFDCVDESSVNWNDNGINITPILPILPDVVNITFSSVGMHHICVTYTDLCSGTPMSYYKCWDINVRECNTCDCQKPFTIDPLDITYDPGAGTISGGLNIQTGTNNVQSVTLDIVNFDFSPCTIQGGQSSYQLGNFGVPTATYPFQNIFTTPSTNTSIGILTNCTLPNTDPNQSSREIIYNISPPEALGGTGATPMNYIINVPRIDGGCNFNFCIRVTIVFDDCNSCTCLFCFDQSGLHSDCATAIGERKKVTAEKGFSINPNPSNGNFTLQLNNIDGQKQILITDLSGKLIQKIALGDNSSQYAVNNLAEGTYLITVIADNYNSTQKIIITK